MVFRNLQGKKLSSEEIKKKLEKENVVSIITKYNWENWIYKSNTIAEKCQNCGFPVMEYRIDIENGKQVLKLGCPWCFGPEEIIRNEEIIEILLNREEKKENQNKEFDEKPLFNEVTVQ